MGEALACSSGLDVLDNAAAVGEVEFVVGKGQPHGGVGLNERSWIAGPGHEIHPGHVERGLERTQAKFAAADVDDPRARVRPGERKVPRVPAAARARRQRSRDARAQTLRRRVVQTLIS